MKSSDMYMSMPCAYMYIHGEKTFIVTCVKKLLSAPPFYLSRATYMIHETLRTYQGHQYLQCKKVYF